MKRSVPAQRVEDTERARRIIEGTGGKRVWPIGYLTKPRTLK